MAYVRQWFTRLFEHRGEREWMGSATVSTVVHVGILIGMLLLGMGREPSTSAEALDSRWTEPLEDVELEEPEAEQPEKGVRLVTESGGRKRASAIRSIGSATPRLQVEPELFAVEEPVSTWRDAAGAAKLTEHVPLAAPREEASRSNGSGAGEGDGDGDGKGAKFFGVSAPGKRFVFVVDSSQSMYHPHPSDAGTRLGVVKLEMTKAIRRMSPDMQFFIVYFDEVAYPMPARWMPFAHPRNKRAYLQWMSKKKGRGNTDPRDALVLALRLRPDVIFFLTDGLFKRRVVDEVTELNRGHVAIHTYCFGEQEGEWLLKKMAQANRGDYKFVP